MKSVDIEIPRKHLNDCVLSDAPICYGILMPGPEYLEGVPVIKVRNFNSGTILARDVIHTSPEIDQLYQRSKVKSGDILLAIRGTTGDVVIVPPELDGANITQDSARIRINDTIDRDFIYFALKSPEAQAYIRLHTIGQAVKGINIGEVRKIPIFWPSYDGRKRISDALLKWGRAINLTERLIAAKQERRTWLIQQLLTGKRRLPGFEKCKGLRKTPFGTLPTDWGYPKIGETAREVSKRNGDSAGRPVLSCTKHQGLVDSLAYFGGKRIFSEDLSSYKLVRRGQFAYATNHIEEGSIGYQDTYDEALISPIYTVFQTDDTIDDSFLYLILKTETYRHIFASNTSASVDRRGSLRWSDFARIHIPRPSIEEQRAIVRVIDTVDRELDLLRSQLDALREQKKGLMQQLLTGKLRVVGI